MYNKTHLEITDNNKIKITYNKSQKLLDVTYRDGSFKMHRYDCKGRLVLFANSTTEKVWEYREDGNANEYTHKSGEWYLSGERLESF